MPVSPTASQRKSIWVMTIRSTWNQRALVQIKPKFTEKLSGPKALFRAAAKIYTGFRVISESILYWVVLHSQNRFLGLTSKLRPMMLSIRILQSNYLSLIRDCFFFIKMKCLMPRSSNSANEEVPIATQSPIMMVHFLQPILSTRSPQIILDV